MFFSNLLDAFVAEGKKDDKSEPVKAEWKDVTFRFLSEQLLQIKVHGKPLSATNYAELGFENKREDKANEAWEALVQLAEHEDHRLFLPPRKDKKNWTVETGDKKRVQVQNRKDVINRTLRAALKNHGYEIPQKPEPLQADDNPATYYQPNFRIELAKSYK